MIPTGRPQVSTGQQCGRHLPASLPPSSSSTLSLSSSQCDDTIITVKILNTTQFNKTNNNNNDDNNANKTNANGNNMKQLCNNATTMTITTKTGLTMIMIVINGHILMITILLISHLRPWWPECTSHGFLDPTDSMLPADRTQRLRCNTCKFPHSNVQYETQMNLIVSRNNGNKTKSTSYFIMTFLHLQILLITGNIQCHCLDAFAFFEACEGKPFAVLARHCGCSADQTHMGQWVYWLTKHPQKRNVSNYQNMIWNSIFGSYLEWTQNIPKPHKNRTIIRPRPFDEHLILDSVPFWKLCAINFCVMCDFMCIPGCGLHHATLPRHGSCVFLSRTMRT